MAARRTKQSDLQRAGVFAPTSISRNAGSVATASEGSNLRNLLPGQGGLNAPARPAEPTREPLKVGGELIVNRPPTSATNPNATHRNTKLPGDGSANALLSGNAPEGRPGSDEFNRAVKLLRDSTLFLQKSSLSGNPDKASQYVVGGQARLRALGDAERLINSAEGGANKRVLDKSGIGAARSKLQSHIKEQKGLATNQRNSVLNVLAEFRAKQRDAQRTNFEVQTGRRTPRSGASVIPRLPGLLGQTNRL